MGHTDEIVKIKPGDEKERGKIVFNTNSSHKFKDITMYFFKTYIKDTLISKQSFSPEVFWHVCNIFTSITLHIWFLIIFNNWEHKQIDILLWTTKYPQI